MRKTIIPCVRLQPVHSGKAKESSISLSQLQDTAKWGACGKIPVMP